MAEERTLARKENEKSQKEFSVSVLTWHGSRLTATKWQWFFIPEDQIPDIFKQRANQISKKTTQLLCKKAIELSLLDENNEIVSLGNLLILSFPSYHCAAQFEQSSSPLSVSFYGGNSIRISPFFTRHESGGSVIMPPKSRYFTISLTIDKEEIPRVRSAKLEVKSAGE